MQIINGFTLIEPPIEGGMARVYKGTKNKFTRAFKFVRPDKAANNPRLAQQFLKEIQLQSSLDHPNILKIWDAYPYEDGCGGSFTVLEMEWLNGLDLQRYIEQKAKHGLDGSTVKKIAIRVLDGLEYAHDHKILHLDIKPSNIFRTYEGTIKIIDFGIAKVVGENASIVDGVENLTLMTQTGESSFKGTMAYASPEQQVGGHLGFYSDIYSFGKTLHFLCTGSTDPSAEVRSQKLSAIIAKCTMQNPKQRYQSCKEIKEALNGPCEKCGYLNNRDAIFCDKCGWRLGTPTDENQTYRKCERCGFVQTRFTFKCDNCGHTLGEPYPPTQPQPKEWHCYTCGKNFKDPTIDSITKRCIFCTSTKIAKVTK